MSRLSEGTFLVGKTVIAPRTVVAPQPVVPAGAEHAPHAASGALTFPTNVAVDLSSMDLTGLDNGTLLETVLECERLIRQAAALQVEAMALLTARTTPARRGKRSAHRHQDDQDNPDSDSPSQIGSSTLVAAMLAPELTVSSQWANTMVKSATELATDLPDVLSLLREGRLDRPRARLINNKMHHPPTGLEWFGPRCPQWAILQAALVQQAPSCTYPALEELINRFLLSLRPKEANDQHARAKADRRVWGQVLPDGMAALGAVLTADVVQLIEGVLDAMADACRDQASQQGTPDPRTHEQRRADALAAIFRALAEGIDVPLAQDPRQYVREDQDGDTHAAASHSAKPEEPSATTPAPTPAPTDPQPTPDGAAEPETHDRAPVDSDAEADAYTQFGLRPLPPGRIPAFWKLPTLRRKGRGPHLVVTITQATLLGLDDTPGLLQGYGAIAADYARQLAAIATSITLLPAFPTFANHLGATGCPEGHDHTSPEANRYRLTSTLIRQIISRHQHCTFPGCVQPATKCDLDHVKPYGQGGYSCSCNMRPACRRHHRLKTFGGWQARVTRPDEPYPPGTIIWTTPQGASHHSAPPCLPGMTGWTLPFATSVEDSEGERVPDPEPDPAATTPQDSMPAATRTARRTRRWQRQIDHQAVHDLRRILKERLLLSTRKLPPSPRPPHAPWGESTGIYPEDGEPPF